VLPRDRLRRRRRWRAPRLRRGVRAGWRRCRPRCRGEWLPRHPRPSGRRSGPGWTHSVPLRGTCGAETPRASRRRSSRSDSWW
jgi:hypothetical protein